MNIVNRAKRIIVAPDHLDSSAAEIAELRSELASARAEIAALVDELREAHRTEMSAVAQRVVALTDRLDALEAGTAG